MAAEPTTPATVLYVPPYPRPSRGFAYETVYRPSTTDNSGFESLSSATAVRTAMVEAIHSDEAPAIVDAIERYLPYLLSMKHVVTTDKDLRTHKLPDFQWTSATYKKHKSKFSIPTIHFEVAMTLFAYAIAKMHTAADLVNGVDDEAFSQNAASAATALREAAGVCLWLEANDLAQWQNLPFDRPPEVVDPLAQVFSLVCLAQAQQLTVKKGGLAGTNPNILAKISLDVRLKYQTVVDLVTHMGNDLQDIHTDFTNNLEYNLALQKGVAYRRCAEASYAAENIGEAVGYANFAVEGLEACKVPSSGVLKEIHNAVKEELEACRACQRKYTLENDTIYFASVITDEALLELPSGKSIATPIEFTPPDIIFDMV